MSFTEGLKEFKAGRFMTAIDIFSTVIEKDDKNHKAWNALGVCYSSLRKFEEADRCFRNAIAIFPGSETYIKNRLINKRKIQNQSFAWEKPREYLSYWETGSRK